MIGQPGVAPRVQDEEVRGVGYQMAGLVHKGDGGRGVGAYQGEENQGEAGVGRLTVVGIHSQNLWLDWRKGWRSRKRQECLL